MTPTIAYAQGALTKMAEHNIEPMAFVRAAVRTQDPLALKIATALAEYEKVAVVGIPVAAGAALLGAAGTAGLAGVNYATGDADTLKNRLMQMSNEHLGTDLETQSRASAGLDRLKGLF